MTAFDGELLERESNIRVTMNGDDELPETVQQQGWSSQELFWKTKACYVRAAIRNRCIGSQGAPSPIQKRAQLHKKERGQDLRE